MRDINKHTIKTEFLDDAIYQLVKCYLKFGLKERNLIKALFLKMPNEDIKITNYIAKLRKEINYKFQIVLKEKIEKSLLKKIDLKFIASSLLGIMDKLILEATLLNKRLNVEKSVSQILQIISPILKINK